jgi:regulatory protein
VTADPDAPGSRRARAGRTARRGPGPSSGTDALDLLAAGLRPNAVPVADVESLDDDLSGGAGSAHVASLDEPTPDEAGEGRPEGGRSRLRVADGEALADLSSQEARPVAVASLDEAAAPPITPRVRTARGLPETPHAGATEPSGPGPSGARGDAGRSGTRRRPGQRTGDPSPAQDEDAGRTAGRRRRGAFPDRDAPLPPPEGRSDPTEAEAGDPESVARAVCLRALTGSPKTRRQLADLLARRGVPEHAAEVVLDRFTEVGLIDDAAFAQAWVQSRQSGRGLARRALRSELRAKGVEADVAAEAVELVDDEDERAAACRLVERKLPSMRRLDRVTATRRLVGMLARKGYNGGVASAVVREALDGAALDGARGEAFRADGSPADGDLWEDDLP